jgi:hypothetical protein
LIEISQIISIENFNFLGYPESPGDPFATYKWKVEKKGEKTFKYTEMFDKETWVNEFTLDEETNYQVSEYKRRILVTQTGPFSYKWFMNSEDGSVKEEIDLTFNEEGALWVSQAAL